MATLTTQDKYVETKCNQLLTMIDSLEKTVKQVQSEKNKARGSVAEDEYMYAVDGLESLINGATKYRLIAARTIVSNQRMISRMR